MATRKIDPALQALIDAGLVTSGQQDVVKTPVRKPSATALAGSTQAPRQPTPVRKPSATALAGYSQTPRSIGGASGSGFSGGGGGAWGPGTTPPPPTAGVGGGTFQGTTPKPMTPNSPGSGLEGMQNVQMVLDQALGKYNEVKSQSMAKQPTNWAPTGLSNPAPQQSQAGGVNYQTGAGVGGTGDQGFIDPKLMSGQEVADLFGYIFGKDQILEILQKATNAKFDEWGKQTQSLRDQSLTDYSTQYNQYLQNSRQNRQNAVRHGLQKGSSVAQEVLGQLGAQQQGAENQTMYQQQMGDIAAQRGSQLAADQFNAMNMQNELASGVGNQAINQYSNEVQQQAAQLSHHGQLVSADAQVRSAEIAAAGQRAYANAMSQAQVQAARMGASVQQAESAARNAGMQLLIDEGFSPGIAYAISHGSMSYADGLKLHEEENKSGDPSYASNKIANWLGNRFGVMPK